jgi:hypothetical protein
LILVMVSLYTLFTLCHFETKRGSIFCFEPGMYFCPRMAKEGVF